MKKKIINKRVNGDSEELHALKGFKVLAVGNGTIGEECALSIMLMNENNVAVDLTITVTGKTDDATSKPVTVTVNGAAATVGTDGFFSKDVTLTNGANKITIIAKDKAGKTTTITRNVTLDTAAPVIKSITLTPNPVDCGKTFVIAVEITD